MADWLLVTIGWIGGIPTGLLVNWLGDKWGDRRRSKDEYFASTVSGGMWEFEGRISYSGKPEDIMGQLAKMGGEQLEGSEGHPPAGDD